MNKRLVLAFGLFFAFMLVFQTLFMKQQPQKKKRTPSVTNTRPVAKEKPLDTDLVTKADIAPVSNGLLSVGLSKVDGTVSSISFAKYKEAGKNINFIEKNISFLRNFRVVFPDVKKADSQKEVLFTHKKLDKWTHQFVHTYKKGPEKGIEVTKTYKFFPEKYYFDLSVKVRNMSGKDWKNPNKTFSLIWGSPVNWRKDKTKSGTYDIKEYLFCKSDGDVDDISEDKNVGQVNWLGLKDRYFLLSIIPTQNANGAVDTSGKTAKFHNLSKKQKAISFEFNEKTLVTKQFEETRFRVFIGPMKYDLLTSDEFENNNYNFSNVLVTFPVVRQISILFEKLIFAVYGFISNFGIVIILVTIILKLVLYPLTHKSVVSMKKMQLIQPKIAA